MSNGTICCLIRACCPEPEQRDELAKKIAAEFGWSDEKNDSSTGNARAIADWVIDHFDLVPKGVGAAIVEGYKPYFKEKLR